MKKISDKYNLKLINNQLIDTSHHDSGSWAVIPVTLITDSPVVPELHLTVKGHVL